jgi:DNA-binding beta-propeller fold protein YncE
LLLVAAGLFLAALLLWYISSPPSTILTVRVHSAETGEPLSGVSVQARSRGEQPLPVAITDEQGAAHFRNLPPDPAYLVRVQKVDYDLTFERDIAVPVGEETEVAVSLAPNVGGRLYVGLDGGKVAEIDTASLSVVQTIRLPGWQQAAVDHVRLHPSKDLLYTLGGTEGSILDSRSGAVLSQFDLDEGVEHLGLTSDEGRLFVVNDQGDGTAQLHTLDATTGEPLGRVQAAHPLTATQIIWEPGLARTYVVEPAHRSLWALDAEISQALDRVETGAYPEEGFLSADGRYLYTWSADGFDHLQTVFGADLTALTGGQSLPASDVAWTLSPTGEHLYLLDSQLGTLTVLDPAGQELPVLIAVGLQPEALVVSRDGDWAYVANRGSRTISVVYLPGAVIVHTIPVLGEPLSLALR